MIIALEGFVVVLTFAFLGVPLCFAMLVTGIAMFALLRGLGPALGMAGQTIQALATNEGLAVLPMFILMGTLIYRSGLAEELYDAAYALIGHRRGGLAYATVMASAAFASMSGSSIATAATMAKVALPPMRRRHYADSLASGCVSSAGSLGCLLPPSLPLLIYGIIAQQDVAKLFIAGIIPGLMLAGLFMLAVYATVARDANKGPSGSPVPLGEKLRRLNKVWGVLVLFGIVVGGLYSGIFTASEAGGVGAMGAVLFTLSRRRLTLELFRVSVIEAGGMTAMIFAVAFGGMVFANFITMSGLTAALVSIITALHLPILGVIGSIVIVYIILGSLMEALSMMLLTVPVFAAVLAPLGVNMVWFGIFVVMMIEIGMIHPPMGMNVFVVKAMAPDVSVGTIFRGTLPFLAANILALALLVMFPALATWLPHMAH
ncbi:MAG: TRAP transporter large permease subunit [Hyphomicrobiales bacterium]|nr:TRAP transporter large permease subunit [Hyphomicrobiales bacterium]